MGNSSSQAMNSPVIVAAQARHTATLIFLHGLGDTGHGWADGFRMMKLNNIKCVCPNAPIQHVTLNAGMKMPSWFDIIGLGPDGPEDEAGIKTASNILKTLIEDEVKSGIPLNRIMVGGFSQGGAVALYTAMTLGKPFAGVVGLSTWMPLHKQFKELTTADYIKDLPIFQGHGYEDPLVPFRWAEATSKLLKTVVKNHSFQSYPMGHSSCPQEMMDVKEFLEKTLP
ncbi:hypothetical protein FSP39_020287 [Pinctada imbricata]|uniref:palmitoyl-protein hydrolase n=1 Tax=Pinctada imbricata TaxID=66713 RepID=A0AA88Y8N3_PINIB|nr:hypothetical protein FSP39_020287 [Pinctada imbricata]